MPDSPAVGEMPMIKPEAMRGPVSRVPQISPCDSERQVLERSVTGKVGNHVNEERVKAIELGFRIRSWLKVGSTRLRNHGLSDGTPGCMADLQMVRTTKGTMLYIYIYIYIYAVNAFVTGLMFKPMTT